MLFSCTGAAAAARVLFTTICCGDRCHVQPKAFAEGELSRLHELIEQVPLATVVSHSAQGLQASHLPLLLVREEGEFGTLYGHFARGNPQWRELTDAAEALLIFQGAEGYVSPSFYPSKAEHGKVVPTWNYQAVHAHGRVEVFDERQRLLTLVSRLSERHERSRAQPWAVDDAPANYIDSMLGAIVGLPCRFSVCTASTSSARTRIRAISPACRLGCNNRRGRLSRAWLHVWQICQPTSPNDH